MGVFLVTVRMEGADMSVDIIDKEANSTTIEDFQLLPSVLSMLQCISKSDKDGANRAALSFQQKVNDMRSYINELPGIHLSEKEQEQLYQQKKDILKKKQYVKPISAEIIPPNTC